MVIITSLSLLIFDYNESQLLYNILLYSQIAYTYCQYTINIIKLTSFLFKDYFYYHLIIL